MLQNDALAKLRGPYNACALMTYTPDGVMIYSPFGLMICNPCGIDDIHGLAVIHPPLPPTHTPECYRTHPLAIPRGGNIGDISKKENTSFECVYIWFEFAIKTQKFLFNPHTTREFRLWRDGGRKIQGLRLDDIHALRVYTLSPDYVGSYPKGRAYL